MSTQIESLSKEKTPLHTAAQIRVMVDMADYAETLLNRHVTVTEVGRWLDQLGSEGVQEELLAMRSVVAGSGGRMRFVG